MASGTRLRSEKPWWRRWDGVPPSVMERGVEMERRRMAVSGWRRFFFGPSPWVWFMVVLAQSSGLLFSRTMWGMRVAFVVPAFVMFVGSTLAQRSE